jgi:hypothetical protein
MFVSCGGINRFGSSSKACRVFKCFVIRKLDDVPFQDQVDAADNSSQTSRASPASYVIVNRQQVEKVAPPDITKSVRRMFESGEIADRHQVPRRIVRIEDEIAAAESGVYESQPAMVDDNVVRDTGEYVSPRAEVINGK